MRGVAATTIAGSFALAAFTVAILAGLASGNPASSVMVRAVIAMVVCYPIGLAAGAVAQRLVQDHIDLHREAHPDPVDLSEDDMMLENGSVPEGAEEEEVLVV